MERISNTKHKLLLILNPAVTMTKILAISSRSNRSSIYISFKVWLYVTRRYMQDTVISQTTSGCQWRAGKQGCDGAWTDSLGVSFTLKEGQLLGERSQNHTDEPMDGASVSQARVLQCSFHPLFPSLSLARSPSSLSLVTLRDTHTTLSLPLFRFPSLSLSLSLPPPLSLSLSYKREQKHLPSLVDLALPFYAIHHLHPSFISLRFLSSNVTSRTINFRPAPTRPSSPPPFSRPFDWSQLFTTKGWSINRLSTHPFGVASWFPSIFPVEFSSRSTCPFMCGWRRRGKGVEMGIFLQRLME